MMGVPTWRLLDQIVRILALRFAHADFLGGGIAFGLNFLRAGFQGATLRIQRQQLRAQRLCATTGQTGVERFGGFTDFTNVVHGSFSKRR